MPRPVKWRKVCSMPSNSKFGPMDAKVDYKTHINMTIDEYETIRLIDLKGMNQEECSKQMNVARTTVQGIYNEARKKIADSIVNGKPLWIGGGEYKLCEGTGNSCHGGHCGKRGCEK